MLECQAALGTVVSVRLSPDYALERVVSLPCPDRWRRGVTHAEAGWAFGLVVSKHINTLEHNQR